MGVGPISANLPKKVLLNLGLWSFLHVKRTDFLQHIKVMILIIIVIMVL